MNAPRRLIVVSPNRITQHVTGRSFNKLEVVSGGEGQRTAIAVPNAVEIMTAGARAADVLRELIGPKDIDGSTIMVFLNRPFFTTVEPLARGLPRGQVLWVSGPKTRDAKDVIVRAGDSSPSIITSDRCADDKEAGYAIWNFLKEGEPHITLPVQPGTTHGRPSPVGHRHGHHQQARH